MNVQQFDYVIAVAEMKNFGEAAQRCSITQSTLSIMIARLEKEIGFTIFNRKTKPVTITKEGEEIIHQLKIITKEINNLDEVVNGLKGKIVGDLKIAATPSIAPYLFPLFLYDFIKRYPNVHFEITENSRTSILENLKSRKVDIGILSTPINEKQLKEVPLYEEPLMLFDKINSKSKKRIEPKDIDLQRLWLLEEGDSLRTQVLKLCKVKSINDINGNLDFQSSHFDTLLKFINKNKGLTILPYLVSLDLTSREKSSLKKLKHPIPGRQISMVMHKHFPKSQIADLFMKDIIKKVNPILKKTDKPKKIISPV